MKFEPKFVPNWSLFDFKTQDETKSSLNIASGLLKFINTENGNIIWQKALIVKNLARNIRKNCKFWQLLKKTRYWKRILILLSALHLLCFNATDKVYMNTPMGQKNWKKNNWAYSSPSHVLSFNSLHVFRQNDSFVKKFKQWLRILQDKLLYKNLARFLRNSIITQYFTEKLRSVNIKLYPISVSASFWKLVKIVFIKNSSLIIQKSCKFRQPLKKL